MFTSLNVFIPQSNESSANLSHSLKRTLLELATSINVFEFINLNHQLITLII